MDQNRVFYVKNKDTGVGNMLFQIASSIAFCIKNNTPLYVIGLNAFLHLCAFKMRKGYLLLHL